MNFDEKKSRAFALMAERNMRRSEYVPPLYRLLWKAGWKVPPPVFNPFWSNFLLSAAGFSLLIIPIMLLLNWRSVPDEWPQILRNCLQMGLIYGLLDAGHHFIRHKANRLPGWNKLI